MGKSASVVAINIHGTNPIRWIDLTAWLLSVKYGTLLFLPDEKPPQTVRCCPNHDAQLLSHCWARRRSLIRLLCSQVDASNIRMGESNKTWLLHLRPRQAGSEATRHPRGMSTYLRQCGPQLTYM